MHQAPPSLRCLTAPRLPLSLPSPRSRRDAAAQTPLRHRGCLRGGARPLPALLPALTAGVEADLRAEGLGTRLAVQHLWYSPPLRHPPAAAPAPCPAERLGQGRREALGQSRCWGQPEEEALGPGSLPHPGQLLWDLRQHCPLSPLLSRGLLAFYIKLSPDSITQSTRRLARAWQARE